MQDAERFAAMSHSLSANAALADGRWVRGDGPRPADADLCDRGPDATPISGDSGQPDAAVDPGKENSVGYDGHQHRQGSKGHLAVDQLGRCWPSWSRQPTNKTVRTWRPWLPRFKRRRESRWKSPLLTRAIRVSNWQPMLRRMGFVWKWSLCLRPSMALYCCLAARWSNAVSPGWHASDGWRATMNV